MPRRTPQPLPPAVAVRLELVDEPQAMAVVAGAVGQAGGRVRTLATVRRAGKAGVEADAPATVEVELEVEEADERAIIEALEGLREIIAMSVTRPMGKVFGKRVIVVGGGAQVAQVALGAVTEADRHNLRGEKISVDTIPLVGEQALAEAVRAVSRLPRARALVLAGSLMGGEIETAVREVRAQGLLVISLNMAGSVPDAADLVVTDPVQAGVMAVMAVADTARFTVERLKRRVF